MNTPALRVNRTHFPVTALGPGRRLGVWVQGCPLACKGCMALDTWDPGGGTEVAVAELARRWREAIEQGATGLTVSGGEPLAQPVALAGFLAEADRIRREAGRECDILLYTGYEPGELDPAQRAATEHADVLVTGRYDASAPTDLVWRGSANQAMVLRTELGRRRFAEHVHERPENPPIQVRVDAAGAWIVGVPRRGTLQRLDRSFKAAGLDVARVSWRRTDAG
ncbi:4Fe-4S single cluster domain-containing protein [Dactylosporangium sp. CA-139066]|uniref:4Fe-4S single cluster domain-containing protein n=1 Tax=Dactylosporangium sp. CA-139066 TaxID=3239930 RepID=UPI003D90D538